MKMVSIPHRYDPNVTTETDAFWSKYWFQFLIGTIQTQSQKIQKQADRKFQFLIGTIQTARTFDFQHIISTPVSIPHRYDPNFYLLQKFAFLSVEFQFLIGTIQTHPKVRGFLAPWPVSIPHRYDPNVVVLRIQKFRKMVVSIPHRYDPNQANDVFAVDFDFHQFQFLIGTIQTWY